MSDPSPPPDANGGIEMSGGSASAGRDLTGGDHIAGDHIAGDKVGGDKVGRDKFEIQHADFHLPPEPPAPPDPTLLSDAPRIWNVPHDRNPNLVGRTAELEQIREAFELGDLAATVERAHVPAPAQWVPPPGRRHVLALTQAIAGLGGIGKTSLAVEYCFVHQDAYDIVWWVRAQDPATLQADYAALAPQLDPSLASTADVPALVDFVREYLRTHSRWLLVFDNANHPGELDGYLPPTGKGQHVLITSRDTGWDEIASTLTLHTLPRADSIRLLTRNESETEPAASATGANAPAVASELAAALGDLPLALEHARAYTASTGTTLAAYLDLFQTRRAALWQATSKPLNYHATVATTWDISFQAAAAENPASADLLNLCAFFAPDDIPLDVIREGAQFLPTPLKDTIADPIELDKAIAALRRYSLVERKNDDLSVHRLVQAVTHDNLTDGALMRWAEPAVRMVDNAFPRGVTTNVLSWTICARLLQHGLAVAAAVGDINAAPEETARLLNQMGVYLRVRAQFIEAKKLFEQALAIDKKQFGPDHPSVAVRVNNLGTVLRDLGDLPGAKTAFERALAIDEKQFGPDHPSVGIRVNNLGGVLLNLGDLPGAKTAFERALAIDEKQFGPYHPSVGIRVNNLGLVLRDLGDLQGAKAAFERALAIDEKQFGPDHPNVAIRVNNLGLVQRDLGDLLGARAAFERALEIDEKQFGPDDPKVATVVNNLGNILRDLGDLQGAKEHLERALAIHEKTFGPIHIDVAHGVNNLGGVLRALGDLHGARAAHERALAIWEKLLGPNHLYIAAAVNNLGVVLRDLGDLQGAKVHLERALNILRQFLGDDHPNTRIVKENLDSLGE